MDAELLLTSQVARLLNVSSETIRQWERSGRLPAQKTATGVRLFNPRDVEQLAHRRSQAVPPEMATAR